MSASNFIKQLGCSILHFHFPKQAPRCRWALRRRLIHGTPPFSSQFGNLRCNLIVSAAAFSPSAGSSSTLISTVADSLAASSFSSPYLSARIKCRNDVLDDFCDALLCFGADSTSVDQKDEDGEDEVCSITCTFSQVQDVGACVSMAAKSIGLKTVPGYVVEAGEQYEWIKKTQESFHPLQIIEGVWIVPEWQTPPVDQAINIILNPSLAFGTGQHPTTKLCLLLLHKVITGGERFLDYGTGSGILAIASLKFGAATSVGVDIDPLAIVSACQNAVLNNIQPEYIRFLLFPSNTKPGSANEVPKDLSFYWREAFPETDEYDVVIANILLNPLLDLADPIVSHAKPGAVIGLSGILIQQIPQIMERYSPLMDDITITQLDDYACISGTRKKAVPTRLPEK